MPRSRSVLLVLAACGIFLGACKKEEEPQSVPVPSAQTAAPVAADTPPPATAPADAAPPEPAAVAPTTPAPGTGLGTKKAGESIDACCSALGAQAVLSGRSEDAKRKLNSAKQICLGVAKLVKEGKTSRAAALGSIKAGLAGASAPAECQ